MKYRDTAHRVHLLPDTSCVCVCLSLSLSLSVSLFRAIRPTRHVTMKADLFTARSLHSQRRESRGLAERRFLSGYERNKANNRS